MANLSLKTQPDIAASLEQRKKWMRQRGKKFRLNLPKILGPTAIIRQYQGDVRGWFKVLNELITNDLINKMPELMRQGQAEAGIKFDAFDDDLEIILEGIGVEFARKITEDEIKRTAKRRSLEVSAFNRTQNDKVLKSVLNVDIFRSEPWLAAQTNNFVAQNVKLIKTLEANVLKDVESIIYQGVRQGLPSSEVSKTIQSRFNVTKNRANLIARDQISKLNGQITHARQVDIGVKQYIWRTSLDERVRRPSHTSKEGKVFSWNKPPADTGHPGEDFQCFVGSTKIKARGITKRTYRRYYSGDIFAFKTKGNFTEVIATPNHPILTTNGFVAVQNIREGIDKAFVRAACINPFKLSSNKVNNWPTISEVFDNFSSVASTTKRVGGERIDFHGDGIVDHDVDIKSLPSGLMQTTESLAFKKIHDLSLKLASPTLRLFEGFCYLSGSVLAFGNTFCSNMSRSNLVPALAIGHSGPLNSFGIGLTPKNNTFLPKQSAKSTTADIKLLTKSIKAFAFKIPFSSVFGAEDHYFVMRDLSFYKFQKIDSVQKRKYNGFVYNIETGTGTYLAENITVSNCRCYAEPILEELI